MPQNRSLTNAFVAWFKNLFTTARQYLMYNIGTREVVATIDETTAITEGFDANAAVYSIIMRDAEKFASIPRYLVDPKKLEEKRRKVSMRFKALQTGKRIDNNKLALLMQRPNEYQGQAAFYKTIRAYYKSTGNSFTWLNRGDNTNSDGTLMTDIQQDLLPVLEMIPLPSQFVEVIPDPGNVFGCIGYIFIVNGTRIPIRKNDIVHWKDINLDFDGSTKIHLRGMSALRPGSLTLQSNNDSMRGTVRMYQNDGAKGMAYNETMDGMSPEQQTQVEGVIRRKVNNNDIKGAVAVVQGKWGYLDFGKSSVDLDLLKGRELSMKELCFLFGVPYELFDSATTFANKEQAQKNWVMNSIIPASKEFDDELNRRLLRAFALEGTVVIACDYSEMHELQEDLAALATWLLAAWWLTPNEKRELMNYEERPEPEFDEPWIASGIMPLSQMLQQQDDPGNILDQLGLNNYSSNGNGKKTVPIN